MREVDHFIDGGYCAAASGARIAREDPATGAPLRAIARGDAADVARAAAAATRAHETWGRTPAAERSRTMLAIAAGIEARLDELARLECEDTGKPLALARSLDIPRAAANFRFFATAILHEAGESFMTERPARALNYVLRRPLGVVGCISPWNLPLYLFTWKIAPALAAGNCVIAKPSELTPTTAAVLCDIARHAGLPAGVLNVVHGLGPEAGQAIVDCPAVRAVSFTGGTVTGRRLAARCGERLIPASLELGGKNAAIVCEDADLALAVPEIARSAFLNQGEICLCSSRILVHRARMKEFTERFIDATRAMNVGDPLSPETDLGALISKAHREKVLAAVERGVRDGGVVACGGGIPRNLPARVADGAFLQPTVLLGVPQESPCVQEETFGPVVTVHGFDRHRDAVAMANGTRYGLAASVWTRDLSRAHRMAARLDAGTVWVNCWMLRDLRVPFGGVKDSGIGREGGHEALRFFSDVSNVCIATGEAP
jgi:aminomuconate-semialdehyde/2-hydroxymuconate-6-semialdehyde dehydrogenase